MAFDIKDLIRTLGSLEAHISSLNQSINDIKTMFEAARDRILILERQNSFWQGGIGAGLAVIAVFGNILTLILSYLIHP
ncbi:MAG: hypothetical protein IBJ00_02485 [Alphaproteobacteria bacterium]|nr:hypothetical protein [Alphaproteobacteria bacterium]